MEKQTKKQIVIYICLTVVLINTAASRMDNGNQTKIDLKPKDGGGGEIFFYKSVESLDTVLPSASFTNFVAGETWGIFFSLFKKKNTSISHSLKICFYPIFLSSF